MLPPMERLRNEKEFKGVLENGRCVRHPLLNLYSLQRKDHRRRVGFVAGKRIGKAVVRNQARRRVREAYRLLRPQVKAGVDLVFALKPSAAEASYRQMREAMLALLKRAGIWAGDTEG